MVPSSPIAQASIAEIVRLPPQLEGSISNAEARQGWRLCRLHARSCSGRRVAVDDGNGRGDGGAGRRGPGVGRGVPVEEGSSCAPPGAAPGRPPAGDPAARPTTAAAAAARSAGAAPAAKPPALRRRNASDGRGQKGGGGGEGGGIPGKQQHDGLDRMWGEGRWGGVLRGQPPAPLWHAGMRRPIPGAGSVALGALGECRSSPHAQGWVQRD